MKRLALLVLGLAAAAALVAYSLHQPYAGFAGEKFVEIPRGASAREIAALLGREGVARTSWQFLLIRALRPRARLQAGEYRFAAPASVREVFDRIARGDVFYYQLQIPEGFSSFDIAAALDRLGLVSGEEFLRAVRNPALIRDLAPEAPSLEGYLFPDTYHLTRHTTAAELSSLLTHRFRAAWQELGAPADVHRMVTLASLVEKETSIAEERPLVASVYANRLKLGMKLDCDPTTVYAAMLAGRYRGTLYRSDLDRNHPYNTYQHAGLPPGPIANPGLASLRAALQPARTSYLYFVAYADGSGRHQFSETLAAHQTAAARYQRAQRQNHKKAAPARASQPKKPRRS